MLVSGITTGLILNKIKRRENLLLIGSILGAIAMFLNFHVNSIDILYVFLFINGFVLMLVAPTVFTIAPETAASPATIGMCMGIISLSQGVAGFASSALIGSLVENAGGNWSVVPVPMLMVGAIGVIASILYLSVMKKRAAIRAAGIS